MGEDDEERRRRKELEERRQSKAPKEVARMAGAGAGEGAGKGRHFSPVPEARGNARDLKSREVAYHLGSPKNEAAPWGDQL